jgi:hypothetical protein
MAVLISSNANVTTASFPNYFQLQTRPSRLLNWQCFGLSLGAALFESFPWTVEIFAVSSVLYSKYQDSFFS